MAGYDLGAFLGAVGIVVGVFMAVLVGLYFWWREREKDYKREIEELRDKINTIEERLEKIVDEE